MTNKAAKLSSYIGYGLSFLALASPAYAQFNVQLTPPSAGFTDFGSLISTGLTIIFIVAALAVLIYLFWGAFVYLTAGDNEDQTKKARMMITNAIVGLIILAAAWAIWLMVINFVPGLCELVRGAGNC